MKRLLLLLTLLLCPRADAGLTRPYTDEMQNAAADANTGTAANELLSSDLTKIGQHLNTPLRLYSTGADAKLHIGASIISVGDGAGKVKAPFSGTLNTSFADTTIDFQSGVVSPSGNVLTDGSTFTLPSTTVGQFRTMVLVWRSDGKVDTHFSGAAASVGALEDVGVTFSSFAGNPKLGYVTLQATASTAFKSANAGSSTIQMAVSGTPTVIRVLDGTNSPLTTAGDLWYFSTKDTRLPLGASGTVIHGGGSAPSYSQVVDADVSNSAAIARSKIAVGTANYVLINDGSGNVSQEQYLAETRGGTGITSTATFPASGTVVTEAASEALTNKTISATSNTLQNIAAEYDFTGDGSTTDFTLTGQTLVANSATLVYNDGRLQRVGSGNAYTRTNANPGHIIFTVAPDNNSWVHVVVVNQQ